MLRFLLPDASLPIGDVLTGIVVFSAVQNLLSAYNSLSVTMRGSLFGRIVSRYFVLSRHTSFLHELFICLPHLVNGGRCVIVRVASRALFFHLSGGV